jgi:hypothetical protein
MAWNSATNIAITCSVLFAIFSSQNHLHQNVHHAQTPFLRDGAGIQFDKRHWKPRLPSTKPLLYNVILNFNKQSAVAWYSLAVEKRPEAQTLFQSVDEQRI